jgi:hypothetical protein
VKKSRVNRMKFLLLLITAVLLLPGCQILGEATLRAVGLGPTVTYRLDAGGMTVEKLPLRSTLIGTRSNEIFVLEVQGINNLHRLGNAILAEIDNEEVTKALRTTLRNQGVLAETVISSRYTLSTEILNVNLSGETEVSTSIEMRYQLRRTGDEVEVWRGVILSNGTSWSPEASTRQTYPRGEEWRYLFGLRAAIEGSIRQNFIQFLERLSFEVVADYQFEHIAGYAKTSSDNLHVNL